MALDYDGDGGCQVFLFTGTYSKDVNFVACIGSVKFELLD